MLFLTSLKYPSVSILVYSKKLQKSLDIPDEVLMTLPSAGDIEDRARRAKEKAERRQARSQTMKDQRPATSEDWGI